jgi:hypothetical protein
MQICIESEMGAMCHPELQRVGDVSIGLESRFTQAAFGTSDTGRRFSMTEGQSEGGMLPSQHNLFKELQELICSCFPMKGEFETKQLSSFVILGATSVGKTVLVSRWILSTRPEKTEGPER